MSHIFAFLSKSEITITKRGVPVAKLVPVNSQEAPKGFGMLKGTAIEVGDLIEPIDEKWNVEDPF